jgi:hypothetical protein
MEYLTTAKITDGMLHGSVESFNINWQNQFLLYKCLVATASHYRDKQKLAMLQVAVHPLRELRHVKNMAQLLQQTNGGKTLHMKNMYNYCHLPLLIMIMVNVQLLSSTASDYDHGQVPAKSKGQGYQHEVIDDNNAHITQTMTLLILIHLLKPSRPMPQISIPTSVNMTIIAV